MISPNEIANKQFDKVMGRGYRPEDVDAYLQQVARNADELIAEKQELEEKIMVLADKLEEYKYDEESFRAALLGAQKLGDSVVRESKAKAQALLDEAQNEARKIKEDALKDIENQHSNYTRLQREVAAFKSKLQLLYKQHLELISSIPVDDSLTGAKQPAQTGKAAPQQAEEPETVIAEVVGIVEDEEFSGQELELPGDQSYTDLPPLEEMTEEELESMIDTGLDDDISLEYTEKPLEFSSGYEDDAFDDKLSFEENYASPQRQDKPRESKFGPLKFGKDYDIKRDGRKK